ncbi:MAG: hypothetical protein CM1200mP41_35410 [Gammaproteobacteria bacterium]|nr:MAG: hypothetical protein CM1200mP41_35410 [Gammaproteobacteria bacterium]
MTRQRELRFQSSKRGDIDYRPAATTSIAGVTKRAIRTTLELTYQTRHAIALGILIAHPWVDGLCD